MVAIGARVIYTGERSPDYPDAAYRGTVVNLDDESAHVLFDDGEEYEVAAGDLVEEGAGG
jgi:hypothetical protein